ncbi:PD-(D/E)XK nuclease-like domain-containing protein [Herbiconiux solani]|uniref:PD-(D/E)XK nuclease-like domain-containing protein n=1 Tax=Herbiconiux solani TaxID=661329 RepID=UPI000824CE43|nr:PD-(D/E)XK nuclease-like domain-containing protein [Herbiconiux solani]
MSGRDGIVLDMPDEVYHGGPELSSTGARKLLLAPAVYRHYVEHPQPGKKAFDVGHVAHAKVLGVGTGVIAYPAEHLTKSGNVSTRAETVEWAAKQRAVGLAPISPDDMAKVDAMAEAILDHPRARAMLEQQGDAEASVFVTDPATGVRMRARFDYLPNAAQSEPWTVDLKTTSKSAHPEDFSRTAANYGYHVQQEWYLHALGLATGDFSGRMKFIVVETAPPHLVGVYPLAAEYAEIGRDRVKEALETYAECTASGVWPGYDLDPDPIQPPTWLMFNEGMIE